MLALRIGPVSARFKGNVKLDAVQAPTRYAIAFEGQGGMAGFGKGTADVTLTVPQGLLRHHKQSPDVQVFAQPARLSEGWQTTSMPMAAMQRSADPQKSQAVGKSRP